MSKKKTKYLKVSIGVSSQKNLLYQKSTPSPLEWRRYYHPVHRHAFLQAEPQKESLVNAAWTMTKLKEDNNKLYAERWNVTSTV